MKYLRILAVLDVTVFPIVVADEGGLEPNCIFDGAETKDHEARLGW